MDDLSASRAGTLRKVGDREASILSQATSFEEMQTKKEVLFAHRRAKENSQPLLDQSFLNDPSLGNLSFDVLLADSPPARRPHDPDHTESLLAQAYEHIDKLLTLSESQKNRIRELGDTCKRQQQQLETVKITVQREEENNDAVHLGNEIRRLKDERASLLVNLELARENAAKAQLAHQAAERDWKRGMSLSEEVNSKLSSSLDQVRCEKLELEDKCRALQSQLHELRAKNEKMLATALNDASGESEKRKAQERRHETVEKEVQMLRHTEMITLGQVREQSAELIRSRQEFQDLFHRNLHLEKENARLLASITTAEDSLAKSHSEVLEALDQRSKSEARYREWGEGVSRAILGWKERSWLQRAMLHPWIWVTRRRAYFSAILASHWMNRDKTKAANALHKWRITRFRQKHHDRIQHRLATNRSNRTMKYALRMWYEGTAHASNHRSCVRTSVKRGGRNCMDKFWKRWSRRIETTKVLRRRVVRLLCRQGYAWQRKCFRVWIKEIQNVNGIRCLQFKYVALNRNRRLLATAFKLAFKSAAAHQHIEATVMAHRILIRSVRNRVAAWSRRSAMKRRCERFRRQREHAKRVAAIVEWQHTITAEGRQGRRLRAVTRKHETKLTVATFTALSRHVVAQRILMGRLRKAVSRQSKTLVTLFFSVFASHAARQKKVRRIAKGLVSKLTHQSVLPSFLAWRAHFLESKKVRKMALSVIGRWSGCSLPDVYAEWARLVARSKQLRAAARKVASRGKQRIAHEALCDWRHEGHVLGRFRRILGGWMDKTTRTVFSAWVQAHEHILAQRDLQLKNAFREWRRVQAAGKRRKGLVVEAVRRMLHGTTELAFAKWVDIARQQRALRKVLGHMHSMLCDKAWHQWRYETGQSKRLRFAQSKWALKFGGIYFGHWRIVAHTFRVARKAIAATLKAVLHRAFIQWECHMFEERELKQRMRKFVGRWIRSASLHAFTSWHYDMWLSRKVRAIRLRVDRRLLHEATHSWLHECKHTQLCELKHDKHTQKAGLSLVRRYFYSWHHHFSPGPDVSHTHLLSRVHTDIQKRAFQEWQGHTGWKRSARQRVRLLLSSALKNVQDRSRSAFFVWSDRVRETTSKVSSLADRKRRQLLMAVCNEWRSGLDTRAMMADSLRGRRTQVQLRELLAKWKENAESLLGTHDKQAWFASRASKQTKTSFRLWASVALEERRRIESSRQSGRRKSMEMAFTAIRAVTKLQHNVDLNVTSKWRKQYEYTRKREGLNALKLLAEQARLAAFHAEQFRTFLSNKEDRGLKIWVFQVLREATNCEKGSAARVQVEWDKLDRKGLLRWGFSCFVQSTATKRNALAAVEAKLESRDKGLLAVAFSGFTLTVIAEASVSTHAKDTWVLHVKRRTLSVGFSAMAQAVKDTGRRKRRAPEMRRRALLSRAFGAVRTAAQHTHSGWQARFIAVLDRRRLAAHFFSWRRVRGRRNIMSSASYDEVVRSKAVDLVFAAFRCWINFADLLRNRTEQYHALRHRRRTRLKHCTFQSWRWIHGARSHLNIRLNFLHFRMLRVHLKKPFFDAWARRQASQRRLNSVFLCLSRPRSFKTASAIFDDWWFVVCRKARTIIVLARISLRMRRSALASCLSQWKWCVERAKRIRRLEQHAATRLAQRALRKMREKALMSRTLAARAERCYTVIRMLDNRAASRKIAAAFSVLAEATLEARLRAPSAAPPKTLPKQGEKVPVAQAADDTAKAVVAPQAEEQARRASGVQAVKDIARMLVHMLPPTKPSFAAAVHGRDLDSPEDLLRALRGVNQQASRSDVD